MRFGCNTLAWGRRITGLEYTLDVIAAAGYEGVELAQPLVGCGDIGTILRLLDERSLELVGITGWGLRERMEYCGDCRPVYLGVEDWEDEVATEAVERGFTVAVHPHIFRRVHGLKRAKELLSQHSELKLLLDTAHLAIAGDDGVKAVREMKDWIVGVHLKDWTPEWGRSPVRYARGFIELGEGVVDLMGFLAELQKVKYEGWVMVEEDWTRKDAASSVFQSACWLWEQGLLSAEPRRVKGRGALFQKEAEHTVLPSGEGAEAKLFERTMLAGTKEIERCYLEVAQALVESIPCELAIIWGCNAVSDVMTRLVPFPVTEFRVYHNGCSRTMVFIFKEFSSSSDNCGMA